MKRITLTAAALALASTLMAQTPEQKGLSTINKSTAEAHIGFLACDELEGREAGYPSCRIAGEYIVSHLKSM